MEFDIHVGSVAVTVIPSQGRAVTLVYASVVGWGSIFTIVIRSYMCHNQPRTGENVCSPRLGHGPPLVRLSARRLELSLSAIVQRTPQYFSIPLRSLPNHLVRTMVRFHNDNGDGLQRLLNKKRTRPLARSRSKKTGHVLSPAQKAQLRLERKERTVSLNQALRAARQSVWDSAKKMHADFQTHSSEYFFRLIMQTQRVTNNKRRTSRWNAFLSKEVQRRNAGILFLLPHRAA